MLKERRGLFGKKESRLGCVAKGEGGLLFTGSVSGAMHAWRGNKIEGSVRYHKRAIDALYTDQE